MKLLRKLLRAVLYNFLHPDEAWADDMARNFGRTDHSHRITPESRPTDKRFLAPPEFRLRDRVVVNKSSGFSRGVRGTIVAVGGEGERQPGVFTTRAYKVKRDGEGQGDSLWFGEFELDLLRTAKTEIEGNHEPDEFIWRYGTPRSESEPGLTRTKKLVPFHQTEEQMMAAGRLAGGIGCPCHCVQYSDSMTCHTCNQTWDMNDSYPPDCPNS